MIDPVALADELGKDLKGIDYGAVAAAARQATPDDSGAQDVAVAAVLNADNQIASKGEAEPQFVVSAFTADEWAAAKALPDPIIGQLYDRLLMSTTVTLGGETFSNGMGVIVAAGVISPARAQEISQTLLSTLPRTSRAAELGFEFITPSDVANARRELAGGQDKDPIELGK